MNLLRTILEKFKKKEDKRNVISINFDDIKPFNGSAYTKSEGKKMSPNKSSDLPEFKLKL